MVESCYASAKEKDKYHVVLPKCKLGKYFDLLAYYRSWSFSTNCYGHNLKHPDYKRYPVLPNVLSCLDSMEIHLLFNSLGLFGLDGNKNSMKPHTRNTSGSNYTTEYKLNS